LFLDQEMQEAVARRFGVLDHMDPASPYHDLERQVALQRFLGYDFVRWSIEGLEWPLRYATTRDTAGLQRAGGRDFVDESRGPITNWDEFEAYPWPDPNKGSTRGLEWLEKHLPDDMTVMGSGGFAHFAEHLTWLMGYETCCVALCIDRDLVRAIAERLSAYYERFMARLLEFSRVGITWGSDDMGFRGGLLFGPDDMREFVLAGHKRMAQMAHDAGRPYLLHSCGKLDDIMEDLIEDVKIDAKHSFEDTIEPVTAFQAKYGSRVATLGGIDLDFLCRASETEVRARVRKTLETCMPAGGYVLGTGNSVANYVPLDNYLAMIDEGRRFMA
jgi:uroporphyrinogen decarboxylase